MLFQKVVSLIVTQFMNSVFDFSYCHDTCHQVSNVIDLKASSLYCTFVKFFGFGCPVLL